MKKVLVLIALVILFSGGTAVTNKVAKSKYKPTAIDQLEHIAQGMDSISVRFEHSSKTIKNLQQ